jgi:hypothetical protein
VPGQNVTYDRSIVVNAFASARVQDVLAAACLAYDAQQLQAPSQNGQASRCVGVLTTDSIAAVSLGGYEGAFAL